MTNVRLRRPSGKKVALAVGLTPVFGPNHHDYMAAYMAIDSLVAAMRLCYDRLVWVV